MNNSHSSLDVKSSGLNEAKLHACRPRESSVATALMKMQILHMAKMKEKMNQLAAETQQRHEKMKLVNEIIGEINISRDKNTNGLDITNNESLKEKLRVARDLGVKLNEDQLIFDSVQRDEIIGNLLRANENWGNDNRQSSQMTEYHMKEVDRVMMLVKDTDRKEEQAKRAMIKGVSGS